MPFHDLDEDVFVLILHSCDVYAVLSFLRVNKWCRRLALSQQLWISLVLELSSRNFMPHLDPIKMGTWTAAQLIATVKCLVCGPETWSRKSRLRPSVSFSKMLPAARDAQILPGGHYFAVRLNSGDLECRDAFTGHAIWTHPMDRRYTKCKVKMLDDMHTAIFLFFTRITDVKGPELSIVQVDFKTGHSSQLFDLELNRNVGHYYGPDVSEDFAAVRLAMKDQRMIIVIDWRERRYAVFACSEYSVPSANNYMAFVPGHIIFTTAASEPPNDQLIFVYSVGSLASRWRSVEELPQNTEPLPHNLRIRPEAISPIMVERLEHNNRVFRASRNRWVFIEMMLYPNPIRHNAYKLMVCASADRSMTDTFRHSFRVGGASRAQGSMLFSYAINVSTPADDFSWTKTSAFPMAHIPSPLSYAGYAVLASYHPSSTTTKIVGPRSTDRFLTKWTGHSMREVMVVSKKLNVTTLSPNGILLVSRISGVEVSCWI
ncbi:hypothetical protein C8R45DRAFT_1000697 [Mycena sanguinolenta]|nr:hypothetical protein C8R45DRAFT_1000697 [Mycena sanguinolenta]